VLHNAMQECMIDIEYAIHHGYVITSPEDKLLKRKDKCLAQRRKAKTAQQASAGAEDPSDLELFSAFESKHVTVKSHHTCGRYIEVIIMAYPACSIALFFMTLCNFYP
jgi:hypothetical protein